MNKQNKDRFYYNSKFLGSPGARSVRILSEYYGPLQRFERNNIQDFLVFFGSARIKSEKEAKSELENASKDQFRGSGGLGGPGGWIHGLPVSLIVGLSVILTYMAAHAALWSDLFMRLLE